MLKGAVKMGPQGAGGSSPAHNSSFNDTEALFNKYEFADSQRGPSTMSFNNKNNNLNSICKYGDLVDKSPRNTE